MQVADAEGASIIISMQVAEAEGASIIISMQVAEAEGACHYNIHAGS